VKPTNSFVRNRALVSRLSLKIRADICCMDI
jgi:hypothetical protein